MQGEEARRPAYRRGRRRDRLPPAVGVFAIALTLALVGVAGALVARYASGAPEPEAWPAATRAMTHTPLPSTATATATTTRTPAATLTATRTATATLTRTATPTLTRTASPTPARPLTATRTATPAATRTASPTRTATPAATRTAPATPTWTPVSEATPTSAFPLVRVRTTGLNANLRAGPGLDYPVIATAPDGDLLLVRARAGDWLQVETPDRVTAWVWSGLVEAAGDLDDVPVLAIPTAGAPPQ